MAVNVVHAVARLDVGLGEIRHRLKLEAVARVVVHLGLKNAECRVGFRFVHGRLFST